MFSAVQQVLHYVPCIYCTVICFQVLHYVPCFGAQEENISGYPVAPAPTQRPSPNNYQKNLQTYQKKHVLLSLFQILCLMQVGPLSICFKHTLL